jgi:hypothetical protein
MSTRTCLAALSALLGLAALVAACAASRTHQHGDAHARASAHSSSWDTIYDVLQHPRCVNCHPSDGIPKQGDDGRAHAQLVQSGPEGRGRFAMRCDACHQAHNLEGEHLPPGAPNWHLPDPAMPLVFAGRERGELCRQLRDPAQNGGKTPAQLLEHMAHDPLVLWGWSPGRGRTPVPTPHADFVAAVRAWVASDCDCPH